MTPGDDPSAVCAICGAPIPEGRGRYRTDKGDVDEECYEKLHGRKEPRE